MTTARVDRTLWSIGLTIVAFLCAWAFAFHARADRIRTPMVSLGSSSSTPLVIVNESDVTSTEPFVDEEGVTATTTQEVIQPVILPTTTVRVGLQAMDVSYFRRLAGDPKPQKGEQIVRVPVLMYHHIRPIRANDPARLRAFTVTPESFEAQLRVLVAKGCSFITPDDLLRALDQRQPLPPNPVLLTFDDGLREHYTVVFPLLKKYHAKATYFVITDAHQLAGYLTDAMMKELDASGLVTIASHTKHHPYLARMSASARLPEVVGSKQSLEQLLGHPILAFAYPYGSWSEEVAREVRAAGYALGFGVRLGSRHVSSSRYQLRRVRVQQGERISDLVLGL